MGNGRVEGSVVGQTERGEGVGSEKGAVEVEMVISGALQELTRGVELVILVVLVEVEASGGGRGHHGGQAGNTSSVEEGVHGDGTILENVTSGEGSSGEGDLAVEDTSVGDDLGLVVGLELRGEESASRAASTVSDDSDGLEEVVDGLEGGAGVALALSGEEGLLGVVGGGAGAGAGDGVVEGLGDGLLSLDVKVVGVGGEEVVQLRSRADGEGGLGLLVIVDSEGGALQMGTVEGTPVGDEHGEDQVGKADDTSSVVGNVGDEALTSAGLSVSEEGVEDVEGLGDVSGGEGGELEDPDGRVDAVIVLHEVGIVLGRRGNNAQVGGTGKVGGDVAGGDVEARNVVELSAHRLVDGLVVLDLDGLGGGGRGEDTLSGTDVQGTEVGGERGDGLLEELIVLLVDVEGRDQEVGVLGEIGDIGALGALTSIAVDDGLGGSGRGVAETSVGDGHSLAVSHGVGRGVVQVGIGDGEHGQDGLRPATTEGGVETNGLILVGRDEVAGNDINVISDGLGVDGRDDLVNKGGGVDAKDVLPDLVSGGSKGTSTKSVLHLVVHNSGLNVEGTQEEALVSRGSTVEGVGVEQGVHHVHQVGLESVVVSIASIVELLTEGSQVTTEINLDVVGSSRIASHIGERVEISKGVHAVEGGLGLSLLQGDRGKA